MAKTHSEYPPVGFELVQDDTRLFRVDCVDGATARETPPEIDHALGKTNLSQALIALVKGHVLGWFSGTRPVAALTGLRIDGSVVDNLIINGLVGVA